VTIIATAISQHGIVQAADPSLTSYGEPTPGPRIFRLPFLKAILSTTGDYTVAGRPLDHWMAETIDGYERASQHPSLGDFARHVGEQLARQRDPICRRLIHIAGYARSGKHVHPEVYYVRNVRGRSADGGYGRPGRAFTRTEEFWELDYPRKETREALREGGAHMYLDGYPKKRLAYMVLHMRLHDFYRQVWHSSEMFRRPSTIADIAQLVELDMRVAAVFLGAGNRTMRGGEHSLQVEVIPAPENAVRL
jgi:hypothetical protein